MLYMMVNLDGELIVVEAEDDEQADSIAENCVYELVGWLEQQTVH